MSQPAFSGIVRAAVKAVEPTGWSRPLRHEHAFVIAKSELSNRGIAFEYNELMQEITDIMDEIEPSAVEAPAGEALVSVETIAPEAAEYTAKSSIAICG